MQFPIGVFGVAIATATLPAISRNAASKEIGEFRHTLAGSIRLAMLLTIPSAVGLAVLSRPIIALIYERGRFTAADTERTAAVLAFYAVGLAGYSALKIIAPAFYALGDARTPMMVSLFCMVSNIAVGWTLVGVLQERGLALATSTVSLLNFALLYFILRRRIGGIEGRRTTVTFFKIVLASAVMAVLCWAVSRFIGGAAGESFAARIINVSASVAMGAGVYYLICWALGVEELKAATGAITRRLRARR
jgi:putative peptidoglycan lipid II flippase